MQYRPSKEQLALLDNATLLREYGEARADWSEFGGEHPDKTWGEELLRRLNKSYKEGA